MLISAISSTTPAPPDPTWGTPLPDFEQELFDITNSFRQSKGLNLLQFDSRLRALSDWKVMNMSGLMYMAHDDPKQPLFPNGRSVVDRFSAYYPNNTAWGENIAYGFLSPQGVFDAWTAGGPGEGHYDNIVGVSYAGCGMGAARGSNGMNFWEQSFGSLLPGPPPPPPPPTPPPLQPINIGSSWRNNHTGKFVTVVSTTSGVTWKRGSVVRTVTERAFRHNFTLITG